MKHSHLFILLLITNFVWFVIHGTPESFYFTTTGQGFALFIHWLTNYSKA